MNKQTIDIVLPAYNPPAGWEDKVITNFHDLCTRHADIDFKLYIVSDGSTRGYGEEVTRRLEQAIPQLQIVNYSKNMGKGYGLRQGVSLCQSDFTIYTDYDFPYTDASMQNVIGALQNNADVVVAVRNKQYQHNLPPLRKFLSRSSHILNKFILGLKIKDTQGGLKGFNAKGREVFLSTTINSFLFDTEFIYKASRKHLNVVAVDSAIKKGLAVSDMGFKVVKREFMNFLKIVFGK